MTASLKKNENRKKGIRRIMRRRIRRTLKEISRFERAQDARMDDEIVHRVRTSCKEVRAALRLVRGGLEEDIYRRENTVFRDTAKPLTRIRDAQMRLKTLKKLKRSLNAEISPGVYSTLRPIMGAAYDDVSARVLEQNHALRDTSRTLAAAGTHIGHWRIRRVPAKLIRSGIRKTYRKACRAYAVSLSARTTQNLHEWRKQSKYLYYQLRFLGKAGTRKKCAELRALTGLLGDDHDLAMFARSLDSALFAQGQIPEHLFEMIKRRREKLERKALALGKALYSRRPRRFAAQFA